MTESCLPHNDDESFDWSQVKQFVFLLNLRVFLVLLLVIFLKSCKVIALNNLPTILWLPLTQDKYPQYKKSLTPFGSQCLGYVLAKSQEYLPILHTLLTDYKRWYSRETLLQVIAI